MSLASLRSQIEALAKRAQPRPGRPHRLTTSESREALDSILAKIDGLPADAPTYPEGLTEAYAELDRVLAATGEREALA